MSMDIVGEKNVIYDTISKTSSKTSAKSCIFKKGSIKIHPTTEFSNKLYDFLCYINPTNFSYKLPFKTNTLPSLPAPKENLSQVFIRMRNILSQKVKISWFISRYNSSSTESNYTSVLDKLIASTYIWNNEVSIFHFTSSFLWELNTCIFVM